MGVKSFEGKVFAVTGAASGIGRALALDLSAQGAKLALCDKNAEGLAETAKMLGNSHHFTQVLDVTDKAAMENFAKATLDNFGCIDGVINNAGVSVVVPADAMKREDFEWQMSINFWGVINGTEAFLPHIKKSKDGIICNISSVFGLIGFPAQAAYNASKFAVRGYTEALRHELAQSDPNVLVSCVHPGGIKTPIVKNARFISGLGGEDHEKANQLFEANAPTTPEKAAQVITKGLRRGKQRILIGPDAKVIDIIQRLMPVSYFKLLGRLLRA
jgi:hypothetical protein